MTEPAIVEAAIEPVSLVKDEPDAIDWLDSGRIRFRIDGTVTTMNAPKLGGLIWFSEQIDDYQAALKDNSTAQSFRAVVKLMRAVFATFSPETSLPKKDDDLPAWFSNPNVLVQILNHFRSVPLGFGD